MKLTIFFFVALLLVFHQDYWQWTNATIDFGFLPRALTYHVGISIAAAVVWMLVTKFCWPEGVEEAVERAKREDAGT